MGLKVSWPRCLADLLLRLPGIALGGNGPADAHHEVRHEGRHGHEGNEGHEGHEAEVRHCNRQESKELGVPWLQGEDLGRIDQGQAGQEQVRQDRVQGTVRPCQEDVQQLSRRLEQGCDCSSQGPRCPGLLRRWWQVRARQGPLRQGQVPLQCLSWPASKALYMYSSCLVQLTAQLPRLSSRGYSRSERHVTALRQGGEEKRQMQK